MCISTRNTFEYAHGHSHYFSSGVVAIIGCEFWFILLYWSILYFIFWDVRESIYNLRRYIWLENSLSFCLLSLSRYLLTRTVYCIYGSLPSSMAPSSYSAFAFSTILLHYFSCRLSTTTESRFTLFMYGLTVSFIFFSRYSVCFNFIWTYLSSLLKL
jgi:hypothetical protein